MRRLIPVLVVPALLAGLLAGGAVGVMVGASTTTTLKACVQAKTLLMRYTSAPCHKGERLLTWSVKGATGATGARGATGATGPQGPAGPAGGSGDAPVGAFYLGTANGNSFIGGPATLASVRVPAGHYLVDFTGALGLVSAPSTPGDATCSVNANGVPLASTVPFRVTFGGSGFALRAYAELSTTTTITGDCEGQINENTMAAQIIASAATRLPSVP